MTERIEPALTPEEWADGPDLDGDCFCTADQAYRIAIANQRLSDTDPRKITRDKLDSIRSTLKAADGEWYQDVSDDMAFLDALASYLPPE